MGDLSFPTGMITAITVIAGLIVTVLMYIVFKATKKTCSDTENLTHTNQQHVARRAIGTRNRIRETANLRTDVDNDSDAETATSSKGKANDSKIGAKKRAKMEAKAERKAQREAELKYREERKNQLEKEAAKRKLEEEKEKLEDMKREEDIKREEEEKLKREEEEYQKMKAAFSIEEEGFDDTTEDGDNNLLQEFVAYIKEKKVVMLEDIAATFRLKIPAVINRIEELLSNGTLTGVIDDRGKFIYITISELQAVADFVKKRGRVSIQELVENSNNLISIQ